MKLFLILVVAGEIGGVWGPLPYGLSECQSRATEFISELREKARQHGGHDVSGWSMHCDYRRDRPQLGDKR